MTYNIFSSTAPAMPKPGKGTEIVKLLLSQVSREMREPLLPMTIPALAAHVSDVEFMYSDNKYHELCGQMGHLIGPSGIGKDQLHDLVEAIMRSFRDHDRVEYKKLEDWARQKNTSCHPVARTSAITISLSDNPRLFSNNPALSANINGKPCCTMDGSRASSWL